jgi:hypothetical protein
MVIWSLVYSRDLSPSTLWQNLLLGTIIQNSDQFPIDDQRARSFLYEIPVLITLCTVNPEGRLRVSD